LNARFTAIDKLVIKARKSHRCGWCPCRNCMKDFIIPSGLREVVYLTRGGHFDAVSAELADHAHVSLDQFVAHEGLAEKMAASLFKVVP
jgi:deoxycytidylate deaminase